MNYNCQYRRGRKITIAPVKVITPAQARERAIEIVAKATQGEDPKRLTQKDKTAVTLNHFIQEIHAPWVKQHNVKSGAHAVRRIERCFSQCFGRKPLSMLDKQMVDDWRTKRLSVGISAVTVITDLATFRSALSKAVEWGYLESHSLMYLRRLKVNTYAPIERYLSVEEERRLRQALDAREARQRAERENTNQWRRSRGYPLFPDLNQRVFVDDLKPLVLFALNTGIRRNAVFHLCWEDIDLEQCRVTLRGMIDKASKKRCYLLNSEVIEILKQWREQTQSLSNEWVFPNPKTGQPRDNI